MTLTFRVYELFYPSVGDQTKVKAAKKICRECPVMAQCREYGLNEKWGIWGGLSERERRQVRRQRRNDAA